MDEHILPSPHELRQRLRYEPQTGKLYWLPLSPADADAARFNAKHAGREAFTHIGAAGYRRGGFHGHQYTAHRVIWALVHGEWPPEDIDHINGDRADNRIENLRAVSRGENGRNRGRDRRNASGVTGVFHLAPDDVWVAHITVDRKRKHIGRFKDRDEAIRARQAAEAALGFHPNHGQRRRGA